MPYDTPIENVVGVLQAVRDPESARIMLDAVRIAEVRAVLQGWDADLLKSLGATSTVYPAGSIPHGWLFDQVSAVIHHGGFGTTAAGLRSGVPSIVIPHIIDQYYWGQRVYELGVGPKYVSRGKLDAEILAERIRQAVIDQGMRMKAAQLGFAIRGEPDGVGEAVNILEQIG
jgi:sterol 3beta-glucosyltransferase